MGTKKKNRRSCLKGLSVTNFRSVAHVFPADLKPECLAKLDACARKTDHPPLFHKKTDLTEVRFLLFLYLEAPSFRRQFIRAFEPLLPTMVEAMKARAAEDDLSRFNSGYYAWQLTAH